ncbi:protein TIFY 4B-like isoform X2 [Andrographis paniculata]|nr:protein TIFY 4B-like isoform X2 [Andrographis paniculata]
MPPEESAGKSTLEKPLNELTEDDIAQVTREDCRRYLKEKGMRRPSWNKSQAIQQVIMLKALLETTPDSDAGSRRRRRITRRSDDNQSGGSSSAHLISDPKGTSQDAEDSLCIDEDPQGPDCTGGFSGRLTAAGIESAQIRPTDSANSMAGQMTIFYCGKINVYDDVPANKAQALLHIAASPLELPEGQLVESSKTVQHLPCTSKVVCTKPHQDSVALASLNLQTVKMSNNSVAPGEEGYILHEENTGEGPSARKASLQRYLEKKNNR